MASVGAGSDAIFLYESVIRGHHIYKRVWTPIIGEILSVAIDSANRHDRFAVAVLKAGAIVGHIPKEVSRLFYFFLLHGGRVTCEVTGERKLGKGLKVPCIYKLKRS